MLATSPDFPELTTFGDDHDEAVARAVNALEEAIAARIHDRKDIPTPSRGQTRAVLPTLTSVKVLLYQAMREQGVGKAELARRLGWHMPQVDRVLDVEHRSRLDANGRCPGCHRATPVGYRHGCARLVAATSKHDESPGGAEPLPLAALLERRAGTGPCPRVPSSRSAL